MRILFLTRSFNSLTQRLWLDLTALGHEVSIEFDIADSVTQEAVALFQPALVIAPFLKRAIPEAVWRQHVCLVVHPGIVGDRGPSALDWAIANGESEWGVTVLQAVAEMDAGPVWATETFAMRAASKSSLYRNEVTEAASRAVRQAVRHFQQHGPTPPVPPAPASRGRWRPLMKPDERRIDWPADDTATVLRKLRAADGNPGLRDELFGRPCLLFDAQAEPRPPGLLAELPPGTVYGRRDGALLRTMRDGALRIGHVRHAEGDAPIKLPATLAFASECAALPDCPVALDAPPEAGWRELRYAEADGVGTLHFPFYNGAMSTAQCERLSAALRHALARPTRVLVLTGGPDYWSNGIHLNVIEAAASAADESWRNINAIDDLTLALIEASGHFVIAALQGNAGAGGVFMALAADRVWARDSVVLNPHYKNMGNLYGSEYWTYLLPRRLKTGRAADVMGGRLPISAAQAQQLGLVDETLPGDPTAFLAQVQARAAALAARPDLPAQLQAKARRRADDEAQRPLADYRRDELQRMHRNFYGFDPSFHIARSNFVHRVAPSWTPRHLALHR